MLRSKTNQWGHAGTSEYALKRSIPPLRHKKKPGRTSNSPPASIEQYRGNVDLSGHIYWIFGNHHKCGRPIFKRECRVVQRSLEEGDSRRQLTPSFFSIERNSQTNPAGWSISEILSAGKPETDDHGPDLISTGGVLINEPTPETYFLF